MHPSQTNNVEASSSSALLSAKNIGKHYPVKRFLKPLATVKALDGVSFSLRTNKTLAIVGESGCGKSTLAKMLMRIEPLSFGHIQFSDQDFNELPKSVHLETIQMIFQNPYGSLNPRKKVIDIIAEPLLINSNKSKDECYHATLEVMKEVGLRPEFAIRYPHMFSGGQRQRIVIARALMLRPKILLCDEPISALDLSVQAQVINLLIDIQASHNLSYIFISHDLSVVKHVSDDIMVLYLGKIVEYGNYADLFARPLHPYTRILIDSSPSLLADKEGYQKSTIIKGELPSPFNPPDGCAFHQRCPKAEALCSKVPPDIIDYQGRKIACHLYKIEI